MSLVKGFTDILTPVNRWVDSAFTRGGGYSNPITFDTLVPTELYVPISEGLYIRAVNASYSNVTVIRSNGVITVTATVTSQRSNSYNALMIASRKNILSAGYSGVLTFGSELVSIDVPGGYAGNSTAGTGTIVYDKIATQPGQTLRIMLMPATSNEYTNTMFVEWDGRTTNNINKTISFSFKNPFIYEGQFCDPPYKESLDCSPSNPYYLKVNEYPNGYLQYQSSPVAMYNKARWGASNAVSFFEHKIHTLFSRGTGTKKLVFHRTEFGSGNNDNAILIGRFAIAYVTSSVSERGYGYAYDFYYQIFGTNDSISAFNGKLTELYKASSLSVVPSIGYSFMGGHIYNLYLEFPDNVTSWGGKIFMEYTVVSDYGRNGTNGNYTLRQPYYE